MVVRSSRFYDNKMTEDITGYGSEGCNKVFSIYYTAGMALYTIAASDSVYLL